MGVSFVRTVIVFVLLMFSLRIMGKRQLGELEPIELTVTVLISNLASQPLQDTGTPLIYGIIPVLTLLASQVLVSGVSVKYNRVRRFLCGKPSILIDNGKIVQSEMRRNRISLDELYVELRAKDVTDISTVRHAILETNGTLSVLLYAGETPVTPNVMGLSVSDPGLPISVICDGRVLTENLRLLKKTDGWLQGELANRRIDSPKNVYLMTVDRENKVVVVRKEGKT